MKLRTLFAIVLVALVLVFAAVNLETFTRSTRLNLLFTQIDAPLGMVMLGVVGVFALLYVLLVARVEIQSAFAERGYRKELDKARGVAEREEESRLAGLTELVEREFAALRRTTEEAAEAARAARAAAEGVRPPVPPRSGPEV